MGINCRIPLPSVTYASPHEVMLIPRDLSITRFLQPFYKNQLMKRIIIIISILNVCNNNLFGQENRAGWKLIIVSIGPNFSNFINSEAPHKINIYGSDIHPGVLNNPDVTKSASYFNYRTSLVKDTKIDLNIGFGSEYFFTNNLSLILSIIYEGKGLNLKDDRHESSIFVFVQNPPGSLPIPVPPSNVSFYDQNFDVKISNKYLIIPILIRKYISQKGVYFQGGFYTGYLLKSQIYTYQRKHAYIPNYDFYGYDFESGIDNKIDSKKEFTMNFDFGISFGTGISYALTDRLLLNTNWILNFGLHKIDKKYNNEYNESSVPYGGGYSTLIRSTNYFGLNSNAKNISSSITVGLAFKL